MKKILTFFVTQRFTALDMLLLTFVSLLKKILTFFVTQRFTALDMLLLTFVSLPFTAVMVSEFGWLGVLISLPFSMGVTLFSCMIERVVLK